MQLNTFIDLINLSKKRCNISNSTMFDDIFKNAINEAYQEIVKSDSMISSTFIPIIDGVATLPSDVLSIIKYDPELAEGDTIKGDTIFTSLTDDIIKVYYVAVPEVLADDTDIPAVNTKWFYAMTTYACYTYYLFKKKADMSQLYLNEWNRLLRDLKTKDNTTKKIYNEYADFGC